MNMLVTVDPSNVHYIMNSNFLNFPKGPQFLKIFDVFGNTFINSDSNMWRNQRKLAQLQLSHPGFHRLLVKTTQDKVEKRLIKVLEHVSKQGLVVDLQDLFQRLTFDSTCILVTSYDPGCLSIDLPHVPFAKAVDDVTEAIFIHHVVPESVWKFQSALCEALRLYPPVPFQHKKPLKPDTLPSGHCVDPKMKILFSLYAMGRMKFIWGEDCVEFKPERWLSERGTIKHEPSYKFLAFNAGPRTCFGERSCVHSNEGGFSCNNP
ncbi:Alkane hydroxylase MAH1 [Camellia lanceoleosa]|uniref:Alkane hydroxylase MAH1 n=1 Tax=Camellia lanceoleosa TaxID=1840588 RepID=A0ACC0J4U9_9ERIC|nr:Alkane hydroxylase MAH1 [Camellia lanceoleosa]